jgi:tRNA (cytosine38-C5)-methyltransferase
MSDTKEREYRVIELYSGIGGMHFALKLSNLQNARVTCAIDINPNANQVYKHNFKDTKTVQKTIEGMKLEDFDRLDLDMILMSPPCQPFTRCNSILLNVQLFLFC